MKKYLGTKLVIAKPMTRLEYNNYRNWVLPADEDGTDEGYLVEYVDGGKANHKNHLGYISWSPKRVFERAYRATDEISTLETFREIKQLLGLWLHSKWTKLVNI